MLSLFVEEQGAVKGALMFFDCGGKGLLCFACIQRRNGTLEKNGFVKTKMLEVKSLEPCRD